MRTLVPTLVAALAAPAFAQVDFSTWQEETYGVAATPPGWTFNPALLSQSFDSDAPSLGLGGPSILSQTVQIDLLPFHLDGFTEDIVGIALGVEAGSASDPFADYLLLKWNGQTELSADDLSCTPGGAPPAGLRLYRVRGVPTRDEFWQGADFDAACSPAGVGLELLAEANNLANIPWTINTTYQISMELGPCSLRIDVGGVAEFDVTGDFASLSGDQLGLFCMSQRLFASSMSVTPIASPASIESVGVGSMGSSSVPQIVASGCPTDGGSFTFDISNPSDLVASVGLLGVGPDPATLNLPQYGATLYTVPVTYIPVTALAGESFELDITLMPDPTLVGADFYAQAGWLDLGATGNVAFTNGVRVIIGS